MFLLTHGKLTGGVRVRVKVRVYVRVRVRIMIRVRVRVKVRVRVSVSVTVWVRVRVTVGYLTTVDGRSRDRTENFWKLTEGRADAEKVVKNFR